MTNKLNLIYSHCCAEHLFFVTQKDYEERWCLILLLLHLDTNKTAIKHQAGAQDILFRCILCKPCVYINALLQFCSHSAKCVLDVVGVTPNQ